MNEVDVLILGGGPGGYVAAIKAAQLGLKTTLVEEDKIGGVCLNYGCIPTKALLKSAQVYEYVLSSKVYGIDLNLNDVSINWNTMLKRKEDVVNQLTGGVKMLLKHNGVTVINGHGDVIDQKTIKVNGEVIKTKHLILATGSSPILPPIDGLKEAYENGFVLTSRELLEIKEIPKSLVIIGGGVIGVEFATLFAKLGTDVTIVEMADEILMQLDADLRKLYNRLLKKAKITLLTKSLAKKINQNSVEVFKDGLVKTLEAEKVLISVGRKANSNGFDGLNLKMEKGNVVTNEKCETSIKGVYAIGDLNGKYQLAHVASAEGIVAVENIAKKESTIDYKRIPACIYGSPEIAFVGLTEEEARNHGFDVMVGKFPLAASGRALTEGSTDGMIKIIADKTYGEILGVHILSPHATDLIAEAVTLMELEGTVFDLVKSIHPHPTYSEIFMEAAHAVIDKPIHSL